MQPEFLLELLKKCKELDIHTCIDTAGYGKGDYDEILKYTDLILYDIKHEDYEKYNEITRRKQDETLKFIEKVQENNIPIWIRHVVVPGLTDSEEHIKDLKRYIDTIKNVEKVELLPFHQLGKEKYNVMGIDYSLPYFKNNGGVTFSGGEALMQPEFLLELLKKCKENGIHTCIDTAGYGKGDYDEILKYTDLILYDIKYESFKRVY